MVNTAARTLALVISAIKNLCERKGSTSREILRYISSVYDIPSKVAKRQMQTALKRGVAYGILRKNGGHYVLPTSADLKRQEIAVQELDLIERTDKSRRGRCKCKKRRRRRRRRSGCDRSSCSKRRRRSRRRRRRRSKRRCKCKPGSKSRPIAENPTPTKKHVNEIPIEVTPDNNLEAEEYSSATSLSSAENN